MSVELLNLFVGKSMRFRLRPRCDHDLLNHSTLGRVGRFIVARRLALFGVFCTPRQI